MTCKQCKYIDRCMSEASFLGQVFDPNYDGEHGCREFDTFTNADRIRAMSDEELAKILNAFSAYFEECNRSSSDVDCKDCELYKVCSLYEGNALEWLKQPAEG